MLGGAFQPGAKKYTKPERIQENMGRKELGKAIQTASLINPWARPLLVHAQI